MKGTNERISASLAWTCSFSALSQATSTTSLAVLHLAVLSDRRLRGHHHAAETALVVLVYGPAAAAGTEQHQGVQFLVRYMLQVVGQVSHPADVVRQVLPVAIAIVAVGALRWPANVRRHDVPDAVHLEQVLVAQCLGVALKVLALGAKQLRLHAEVERLLRMNDGPVLGAQVLQVAVSLVAVCAGELHDFLRFDYGEY